MRVTEHTTLVTPRLRLRIWNEGDRNNFADLNADPIVMADLGGPLNIAESNRKLERYTETIKQNGYGRWLVETKEGEFLGYCGVMPVRHSHPMESHDEIGWRLVREAWGKGYATEAGLAVLHDVFSRVQLSEIVAYTAPENLRSQAIMNRLRMMREPTRDFIIADHRLGQWKGLVWSINAKLLNLYGTR